MSLKVPTRQVNGTTGTTASTKAVILVGSVQTILKPLDLDLTLLLGRWTL